MSRQACRGRMLLRAVVTKRPVARVAPRLRGAIVTGSGCPWLTVEFAVQDQSNGKRRRVERGHLQPADKSVSEGRGMALNAALLAIDWP